MEISLVRSALAETCGKVWASQLERRSSSNVEELTPVETQALVFAVIDGRAGVEIGEDEMERILEMAAEAKRVWRRLENAMLGLATLRCDGKKLQVVTRSKECELGGQRMPIDKLGERLAGVSS